MTNERKTPWTPGHFGQALGYIITCNEDGSIPLSSKIVGKVDGDDTLRAQMLERANEAPAMAELLDVFVRWHDMRRIDPDQALGFAYDPIETARALLARIGGPA